MQVNGRVFDRDSGQGIGGVQISNGEDIVQSNEDGTYVLSVDETAHAFVWITVPKAYEARDGIFHRMSEIGDRCDFPLILAPAREKNHFRMAQVTDTHVVLEADRLSTREVLARSVQQLMHEADPDLVIISGDLTNRGTIDELTHFKEAVESVDVPVFLLFGGHDGNEERFAGEAGETFVRHYEQILGPTYFSFDWGGWHFVLYPNEESFFSQADQARKRKWFWADLALQPEGRPIAVVVHTPPSMEFLKELNRYNVSVVLHGHWHSSKAFFYNGIGVMASPPLCFGGIDTTPRGYRLMDFDREGITSELKALDAEHTHPPDRLILGEQSLALMWQHETSGSHRAIPLYEQGRLVLSLCDEDLAGRAGLACLDAESGEVAWQISTDASIKNCAVSAGDGCLAAVSITGRLYLVDGNAGCVQWEADLPGFPERWIYTAPAVADGVVYAGARKGYGAYSIETGDLQWYSEMESEDNWSCYARPQVYGDLVITLVPRRALVALSRQSGEVVWEQPLAVEYPYSTPVVAGDLLISGGDRGCLAVLRAQSGEILWHNPVLEQDYPSGLAVHGERIFATMPSGEVRCHDLQSGVLCWKFQSGPDLLDMTPYKRGIASILAEPVIYQGLVLVGANDGVLYALDAETGQAVGRNAFGAPISAAPVVLKDGLCVATWHGQFFRFRV